MNQITDRTPQLIAAEINSIKEQTRKMLLFNSIEIGRRLVEAKTMIGHGEWGEWLEKSVDYSQRTASNLMRIFEEYGSNQMGLFGNNANSQAFANLSYTQAVALLGVAKDEREQFIEDNDVPNMSTRELQQAIKEKQELEEKLKAAEEEAKTNKHLFDTVSSSYKRLEKTNEEHYQKSEQLRKELEEIKHQLADAEESGDKELVEHLQESLGKSNNELQTLNRKIEDLERQLKEKPIEVSATTVVEKVPEEIERELNELREKTKELESQQGQQLDASIIKFTVCFESLVKVFKDLLAALTEITDSEKHEKYKNATKGLIGKMDERL